MSGAMDYGDVYIRFKVNETSLKDYRGDILYTWEFLDMQLRFLIYKYGNMMHRTMVYLLISICVYRYFNYVSVYVYGVKGIIEFACCGTKKLDNVHIDLFGTNRQSTEQCSNRPHTKARLIQPPLISVRIRFENILCKLLSK